MEKQPEPQRISSAGRVMALLKPAVAKGGNQTILATAAAMLGEPEDDREAGLRCLAGIHRLLKEAKLEIESRPELRQDLYLSAINSVETILAGTPPSNPWQTVGPQLQQALIGLEFCAEQMDRLSEESVIPAEEIQALLETVERLQKDVLAAKMDPVLRQMLVAKLEELRAALLSYWLNGAKGLREAVDSCVGGLVREQGAAKNGADVKEVKEFLDCVIACDNVVQRVMKYAAIAAPVVWGLLKAGAGK